MRLFKRFNEDDLKHIKSDLIDITEDGVISQDELPKLKIIMEKLDKMAEIISEMKIVSGKYLKDIK